MATRLDPHFRDLLDDLIERVQLLDGVYEPGEVQEEVRETWATTHLKVIKNIVAMMAGAEIGWDDADQEAKEAANRD